MKKLKWLYPGMLIKRWIFLAILGISMISMGFVVLIFEQNPNSKLGGSIFIIAGILCVITSVKRILRSIVNVIAPGNEGLEKELVEKVYARRILEKGPRIVVIGGGTGLSTLLTGLKQDTGNLTAIVTVADDGGSSGRLRKDFGVLPPGDIRNCLVALADSEDLLQSLFQFRFQEGEGLYGHNFGNLFITALSRITGDFAHAIRHSSKVLAIRGNVFPATLETVQLVALRKNGREIVGESRIRDEKESPMDRLYIRPENCKATDETLKAIREADAVILGPGSLYTSVMPNLLIEDIRRELVRIRVPKIYVCNVMTEPGETDNYSVSDHMHAVIKHTHPDLVTHCVGNVAKVPKDLYGKYRAEDKYPVRLDQEDERWFKQEKIELIKADIADMKQFVRHDPAKISKVIMEILSERY